MATNFRPVKDITRGLQNLGKPAAPLDCIFTCNSYSRTVRLPTICAESPILARLWKTTTQQNDAPVLSMHHADPAVVDAVIEHIESLHLITPTLRPHGDTIPLRLRHSANVYIIAKNLQMETLKRLALIVWSENANSALYGAFSVSDLTDLMQLIWRNTGPPRTATADGADVRFRFAALRLAAAYRGRYLNIAYTVEKSEEVQSHFLRKPDLHKQLLDHERELPALDAFLTSEEPLAWELAKTYDEEVRELSAYRDSW